MSETMEPDEGEAAEDETTEGDDAAPVEDAAGEDAAEEAGEPGASA